MSWHFAAVIDDTLGHWRAARRRVLRRNAGQSAVHAWRICSRQLFALEELLGPDKRRQPGPTLHDELHRAFHASGKLRDSQLAVPRLERLAPTYSAATKLARHLRRRLPGQRRQVLKRVRDVTPRRLRRTIKGWANLRAADFEQFARDRAVRRLARAVRPLVAANRVRWTTRSMHCQRIRLKSLRYMTKMCRAAGLIDGQSGLALRKLAVLQSALGDILDIQVLLKYIEEYGRRHNRWRREISPLRIHLQNQRQLLMNRLQQGLAPHVHQRDV